MPGVGRGGQSAGVYQTQRCLDARDRATREQSPRLDRDLILVREDKASGESAGLMYRDKGKISRQRDARRAPGPLPQRKDPWSWDPQDEKATPGRTYRQRTSSGEGTRKEKFEAKQTQDCTFHLPAD